MHKPITFLLNTTALSYVPSPPCISQSKMFPLFYKNSWIPLTHKLRIYWHAQISWKTPTAQFYAFHIFIPLKSAVWLQFCTAKNVPQLYSHFFSKLTSLNQFNSRINSTVFSLTIRMLEKFVSLSIVYVNGKMLLIFLFLTFNFTRRLTER